MSTKRTRIHRSNRWCIDVEKKTWVENLAGLIVFGVVVAWSHATLQTNGANLAVIVGTLGMAMLYLLLLFGQRVTYLRIGDRLVLGMKGSGDSDDEPGEIEDWREENR